MNPRLLLFIKIIVAAFVTIGVIMLFMVKTNLTGTGHIDFIAGTTVTRALLVTPDNKRYALDNYATTYWFWRKKVKITGYIWGNAEFDRYGKLPLLYVVRYQILDTKNTLEGQLTIWQDKLALEYREYWDEETQNDFTIHRVILAGADVEKSRWLRTKSSSGPRMRFYGKGYCLPNSIQEIFEYSSYNIAGGII